MVVTVDDMSVLVFAMCRVRGRSLDDDNNDDVNDLSRNIEKAEVLQLKTT